jgi:hypothetical protein
MPNLHVTPWSKCEFWAQRSSGSHTLLDGVLHLTLHILLPIWIKLGTRNAYKKFTESLLKNIQKKHSEVLTDLFNCMFHGK